MISVTDTRVTEQFQGYLNGKATTEWLGSNQEALQEALDKADAFVNGSLGQLGVSALVTVEKRYLVRSK